MSELKILYIFLNLRFKNQEADNIRKILIVFFLLLFAFSIYIYKYYAKQQDKFNASKLFLLRLH